MHEYDELVRSMESKDRVVRGEAVEALGEHIRLWME